MTISVALFVQIVNFIIAYLIIRVLVLKPAVSEILHDEEHQARLQEVIDSTTQSNRAKERTLEHKWIACRDACAKKAPDVLHVEQELSSASESGAQKLHESGPQEIIDMAREVANNLVERISHVK
jgi:F0F1-type ATP synthase membrane subunit b/b'